MRRRLVPGPSVVFCSQGNDSSAARSQAATDSLHLSGRDRAHQRAVDIGEGRLAHAG